MNEPNYYIVYKSEDGVFVNQYSKSEIQKLLSQDEESGDIELKSEIGCNKFLTFDEMNSEIYSEDSCVIIKGEVIIPIPQKVITKFEI